ncbi:MAG TPA: DUF5682 family protein [Dongiaceae bacterium]|nr:DUF5682 family protein [Dongiaceae bacterium]
MPRGDGLSVHLFGVRHHGPGSARSLVRALDALEPDIVLVEGPPDADAIVPLAAHAEMRPPVAILVYAPDAPQRATFYPFASFSPEWQALRWALARGVPVRFMDLPQANQLVPPDEPRAEDAPAASADETPSRLRDDPLEAIAEAAGFSDGERWWDQMVERRRDDAGVFAAVAELMTGVRAQLGERDDPQERRREASMRQIVRAAAKQDETVAVVCGAWHVPALATLPPARADAELLKGLPKAKVAATWIPWTFGRLTAASGYGAGIDSPGWYEHLWETPERVVAAWMTKASRCFRDADLDVSPAHAIEATRLADALAALRAAPLPGLRESLDAIRTVYCFGDARPMALLAERLVVGERLGEVPDDVPQVPLVADVAREQKRLRLPPDPSARELDLDLRKPGDLDRSRLLHRLNLLGVAWGALRDAQSGKLGTFHEVWALRWHPEFAVTLIEASAYGNALADAAAAFVRERAGHAQELAELTALLDATFAAALGDVASFVLARVRDLAARTHDVGLMLDALPALVRTRRYGDVRGTDVERVGDTIDELVRRACVGLPAAVLALDDAAAEAMDARIAAVDAALRVLDDEAQRAAWHDALTRVAANDRVHGLVAGRAMRLLFDAGALTADDVRTRLSRALSFGTPPAAAAAWIDGLLRGSGLLIVHHPELLDVVDDWLVTLDAEAFVAVLPLARRAFAAFAPPERRAIGERVAAGRGAHGHAAVVAAADGDIDLDRARLMVPVLQAILGGVEVPT